MKENKEKIIFINPPMAGRKGYKNRIVGKGDAMPSLGLISLAAAVREDGFLPTIIEAASLNLSIDEVLKQVFATSPKYIGLTATTPSIYNASLIAKKIKERDKFIRIFIGGPHITSLPKETMNLFPEFDVGIIGEGERTLRELLHTDSSGENILQVKGVIIRQGNELYITNKRPYIENLDELPFPAYELLPPLLKCYHPPIFRFKRLPMASIVTTRGCVSKCTFCDRSVFGNQVRFFSATYVVEMIKKLCYTFKVKEILIEDDTFSTSRERVIDICEMLIKEKLDVIWSFLGRINTVDLELLKLMKRAGCWQIAYGIETGNQEILDFVKKNITLDQIEKGLKWTKKAGINTRGFIIMGFPLETCSTMRKTIDFVKRIDLDDINFCIFTPFIGTEIYKNITKYGTFEDNWAKMNMIEPVFTPHGVSKEDIMKYIRIGLKEFYLRHKIISAYLIRIIQDYRNILMIVKDFWHFCKIIGEEFVRNKRDL